MARVAIVEFRQPDIHFATSDAGTGIAYWEIGSGPALVIVQNLVFSHAELEWSVPMMRDWYLDLAKYFRVIRLDLGGSGMSEDPPFDDFKTVEQQGRDVAAVVAALGLEEFNLMGIQSMGGTVVQYAVDHPDQVTGLVLCDTGPAGVDLPLARYSEAATAAAEFDVMIDMGEVSRLGTPEDNDGIRALVRASVFDRPHMDFRIAESDDVTGVLADVKPPTLVIRSADSVVTTQEQTRRLVMGIPGAQMQVVPGVMAPWTGESVLVVEALVGFLTSGKYRPDVGGDDDELRTIVFTDLVSSTEMLSRLGDEHGRSAVRFVEVVVTDLCGRHHGRLVKNLGDGSLVSFKSTGRALQFALDLQDRMKESPFGMRIGMAAGEPIQEDGDVHGAVVVQASRIADLGDAGETIVSNSVRLLSVGKDFQFEPWGEIQLKGFDEPSTLWKVVRPSHA